jgi:hypothetical protein
MTRKHGLVLLFAEAIIIIATPIAADAKQRELCTQGEFILWRDTRIAITRGEFNYLEKPIVSPPCSCADLKKVCVEEFRDSCDQMENECIGAISTGGNFCIQNKWGGQSCYK